MEKRITISYEITNEPKVHLLEQDLNELPKDINIDAFKRETEKYLGKIDNFYNLIGKKIDHGDLYFVIKEL